MWYFCSDHGIIRTLDLPIYITRVKVRLLFRKCHRCGSHFSWYRGVLALTTATETKTSLKKWICTASNSFALIPSHSKSLMLTNCPFLVFMSFVRHEIRMFHVIILQQRQRNAEKVWCTCRVVVWPIYTYYFFAVVVAVAVVVAKAPY